MTAGFATSMDGTRIAYWSSGHGHPLLIAHGLGASHLSWAPFVEALGDSSKVCTYDRRGRGESGDQLPYAFDHEVDDVLAVAAAVGPTAALGHSLGGALAMEAALRSATIGALIVFDGWYTAANEWPTEEILAGIEALVAAGQLAEAFHYGDPPESIELARQLPDYAARVAATPTWVREFRGHQAYWTDHPVDDPRWTALTIPVLLLISEDGIADGMDASARVLEALIPNTTVHYLKGLGHAAYRDAPQEVASVVREWLAANQTDEEEEI
jgi:pimeloyl-ACP methyl ester carboxylesterase